VEVFGPSLSQELTAARWRIELKPALAGPAPTQAQWEQALAALMAAESLIWEDTDKKGRPRRRDCRTAFLGLALAAAATPTDRADHRAIALELEAAIDPSGRSVRPEQLQHWLAETLGVALELGRLQRQALVLKPVLT